MTPLVRKLGITLVCLALAVTTGTAYAGSEPTADATAAAAGGQVTAAGAIRWKPCVDDRFTECGTLRVPIDWAKPDGGTFELALARRKATDPARRIGALVINPGGPGGSGVDFTFSAGDYFSPEVLARFDIVGFDPRGVARSNPVVCSAKLLSQAPAAPRSQAEFDRLVAYNRALGADCRRHTGPLIDHVDTISVARDIDAIRRALGERKLNYYGVSYGTLMGQQYAELFGANIRSMVIDSNMDHSLGARPFLRTEAESAEDSFDEFAAWCDREPGCALHGRDVGAVWDELLARADRGELHDPNAPSGRLITADEMIHVAFGSFYGPSWFFLADWIAALESGRPSAGAARAPRTPRYGEELGENPFQAVFCQDWKMDVRTYAQLARYTAEARAVAPHMRGSSLAEYAVTSCLGWPTAVTNPQHRLKVKDAPPLLMLNALHDPATGYNWAVNAHRQMKGTAVLVTYEGWGHGVYDRSACTRRVTDRYLLGLTVPKDGTRCAAVPPAELAAADRSRSLPVGPRPAVPGWVR